MNKLRLAVLSFLFLIAGATTLSAQSIPTSTELGIIVGEPTGISAKFWTGGNKAIDLGLAWSFGGRGAIHIHSDYLLHGNLNSDAGTLMYYYGIGGRVLFRDDPKVGVRVPVGLQYIIPDSRLGIFFELAPLLNLVPATDFDVNGGLGIRLFL